MCASLSPLFSPSLTSSESWLSGTLSEGGQRRRALLRGGRRAASPAAPQSLSPQRGEAAAAAASLPEQGKQEAARASSGPRRRRRRRNFHTRRASPELGAEEDKEGTREMRKAAKLLNPRRFRSSRRLRRPRLRLGEVASTSTRRQPASQPHTKGVIHPADAPPLASPSRRAPARTSLPHTDLRHMQPNGFTSGVLLFPPPAPNSTSSHFLRMCETETRLPCLGLSFVRVHLHLPAL